MQPSVVLVIVIVVVFVGIGVAVARASGRSSSPPPAVGEVPEDTMFQIRQLLGEGKKIQAIKVLRDSRPGMGLKDAKDYVEALQAGHEPPPTGGLRTGGSHDVELTPDLLFRVRQLLGENKKIQAIKELRAGRPGMGLKEAKDLVEAIEGGYEPPVTAAEPPAAQPQVPAGSSDLAARARELRDSGQETLAIRLVCDETGMGILDAQKFVRSLG
ncbi:ribosomal protein L7/L12 [Flindersiella endophytica]